MKFYQINICDVDSAHFENWFNQMDNERKNIILQTKIEHKRNLRIAADALCRKAVSEYCGVDADRICFELSPAGKPAGDRPSKKLADAIFSAEECTVCLLA